MYSDWRNFLQRQGAVFDVDRVLHFGNPKAELQDATRMSVIADLSGDDRLIAVEGQDSRSFLQGQLSTNVTALTPALSQFSSWSNAKGRVVTTLRIFERGDHLLLSLPAALAAVVLKRLSMYLLRAKAKLTDISDTLARFGLTGDQASKMLTACGLAVPAEINAVTDNQGIQVIRLHGTTPRFSIHGEATQLGSLWIKLAEQGVCRVGSSTWTLLRILAGEPSVHPETSEHFVAQMLGLEELGAIHFNKGCYLGQEVIARAHYRGAVKRHLHRAYCSPTESLKPGMAIQTGNTAQPVGEIADACCNTNAVWQLLVVLQDEAVSESLKINGSSVHLMAGR